MKRMITLQKKLIFGAAAQILIFTGARAEDCGKLAQLQLGHVTVTKAEVVPAGSSDGSPAEKGIPAAKTDYCRVQGTSRPTADSEIRFELWIPAAERHRRCSPSNDEAIVNRAYLLEHMTSLQEFGYKQELKRALTASMVSASSARLSSR
jgi:hypothetical protein